MLRNVALLALGVIAVQAEKLSARDAVCAMNCNGSQQDTLKSLAGDVIFVDLSNDLSNGNKCTYNTVTASDQSVAVGDNTYSFDTQTGCYYPDDSRYSHDDFTALSSCAGVFLDAECNADGSDSNDMYLIITRAAAESYGADKCIASALQQLRDETDFNIHMRDIADCLPSDSAAADCEGLGNGLNCILAGVLGLLDLGGSPNEP